MLTGALMFGGSRQTGSIRGEEMRFFQACRCYPRGILLTEDLDVTPVFLSKRDDRVRSMERANALRFLEVKNSVEVRALDETGAQRETS